MTRLTCIPPANRRNSANQFSSMRAATRSGMVFIGPATHQPSKQSNFVPKAILSDPQIRKQRENFYAGLHEKSVCIKELLMLATDPKEIEFWQQELKKTGGLG